MLRTAAALPEQGSNSADKTNGGGTGPGINFWDWLTRSPGKGCRCNEERGRNNITHKDHP